MPRSKLLGTPVPGDVAVFETCQPVTVAKIINESSLFILLSSFISLQELKLIRK
jgi:hypothetical protein